MIMFNKWFTKFLKILQPALVLLLFILAPVISDSHTTSGEIFEKCKSENLPPPTMFKLVRKLAPFHNAYTNNIQTPIITFKALQGLALPISQITASYIPVLLSPL